MIRNTTKKTVLAQRQKTLGNIFSQGIGLMFSRRQEDLGLVFCFKNSADIMLHNWFVFYSIDLIFLDSHMKVVEIRQDFKPFTCYKPKSKFNYLVEVVAGKVKESRTGIGDTLDCE